MSASELDLLDEEESQPEKKAPETAAQRVERELAALRETGILKKALPAITMSTFHQLQPREQSDFIRGGGKLCDDPAPEKRPLPKDAMTRSRFNALSHNEKMEFIKTRRPLIDEADYLTPATKSSTVFTRSAFRELPIREQTAFLDAGGTITD